MSAARDDRDKQWMKRALALARRAAGDTGHYPMVGAVLVKNGRKVGEGFFTRPGAPHAEVVAIKKAGARARGATLYVNLEPCSHYGRTPPCADAVIAAGVKKVVAGMTDPNPLVSGRGFKKLAAAGVQVVKGVLEEECRELNKFFIKFITTRTPYVIMKAAATLDGKLAAASGQSKWITGEDARKEVHRLRDLCQAVMVGAGTVRRDDCRLTVRLAGKGRHPRPVVMTSSLELPLDCNLMKTAKERRPILFCTRQASSARRKSFEKLGAEVVVVKKDSQGGADLAAALRELGKRDIASLLLEGGSALFGSAIRAGVVDEAVLFFAPLMLGGDGVPLTRGPEVRSLSRARRLSGLEARRVGEDLMVRARFTG